MAIECPNYVIQPSVALPVLISLIFSTPLITSAQPSPKTVLPTLQAEQFGDASGPQRSEASLSNLRYQETLTL
jgi:hypothetical protein